MGRVFSLRAWEQKFFALLGVVVAVLFFIRPHALGFVSILLAAVGMFYIEQVGQDNERSQESKQVFLAHWIACWVLGFGFKFGLTELLVPGLVLVWLASLAAVLWVKDSKYHLWLCTGWMVLTALMLICVCLGRTPLGPINYQ